MSLYDQIGGAAAVNAAVDLFYDKVLNDPRLKEYFEGIDMQRQRKKQKDFLTFAFGGPKNYSGAGLRAAHKKLVQQGINDREFDAVIQNLRATLEELSVPADLMEQVLGIARSTRADVLDR